MSDARFSTRTLVVLTLLAAVAAFLLLRLVAPAADSVAENKPNSVAQFRPDIKNPEAVAAVESASARVLSVLRRPTVTGDAAPASAVSKSAASYGANAKLARRAFVDDDGVSYFVVPAREGVCLASADKLAALCATAEDVSAGDAIQGVICAPGLNNRLAVQGILPDGVSDVGLKRADGSTTPIAVRGNAFSVKVDKDEPLPTAVEWDDASGRQSAPAHIPSDAAAEVCAA